MSRKYQLNTKALTDLVMSQIPGYQKNTDPLKNRTLTLMAEAGNMSVTSMLQNLIMKKKKELLAMHKTPITFDQSTGRWWTRLPDGGHPSNKHKCDLEDRVIAYYMEEIERQKSKTLAYIYDGFMAGRSHMNANTRAKDAHIWETYLKGTAFADMGLDCITRGDIHDFLTGIIVRNRMKKAYFQNIKSFLNLMLTYALDREFITVNKMASMKFKDDLFAPAKKHKTDEDALNAGEIQQLIQAAEEDFTDTDNPAALGICIALLTGVRVGELCGLKFSDFNAGRQELTLSRMLISKRSRDDVTKLNGYEIVDGLKKGVPERTIYIDADVLDYISRIRSKNLELGYPCGDDDYVFWRNNHNTNHETVICTNRTFDSLLRTYCRRCGFKYAYSMHDIRRTYISTLGENSVPLKDIQRQAGHSTPEMTMRYFRSVSTDEEQRARFDKAFASLKKHAETDAADDGKER